MNTKAIAIAGLCLLTLFSVSCRKHRNNTVPDVPGEEAIYSVPDLDFSDWDSVPVR